VSDESFVEKLKRITCEKEEAKGNLVRERGMEPFKISNTSWKEQKQVDK
jgi:hypothetical protein